MKDYSSNPTNSNQDNEIDLITIFNILKINKWIILASLIFGFILGYMISLSVTSQYEANTIIQVDNQISGNSVLSGLSHLTGKVAKASPAEIQTALMKSSVVLEPLVKKLGLNIAATPHYYPLFGKLIANQHENINLAKPLLNLKKYAWGGEKIKIAKFTVDGIQFDHHPFTLIAGKNTNYTLIGPQHNTILYGKVGKLSIAKNYAHTAILVSELKARPGEEFTVKLSPVSNIIKKLQAAINISDAGQTNLKNNTDTGILKISLNWSNKQQAPLILNQLTQIAKKQNIIDKSQKAEQALQFTEQQIVTMRKELDTSEQNLNNYKAKIGIIDIQAEAANLLHKQSFLAQKIQQLQTAKLQLSRYDQPNHPTMLNIQSQINELQKTASQLHHKIKTTPHLDQEAITLTRDVKVKETLYSSLFASAQQLKLIKAGTISDLRILNNATTPLLPLPMHKNIIILASTLGFAMLAAIALIMRQLLASGVTDPQIFEEEFSTPVQSIIPFSSLQVKLNKDKSTAINILAIENPKDPSIEGLRSLRTTLSLKLLENDNNIINILGASPGIGKSFISLNLAHVFAETQKKVLLICCDLRKGKINKHFNKLRSPGLSEYLMGNNNIHDIIQQSVKIDFIASGHYPKNPSELLLDNRLTELFEYCKHNYDLVIIDTPPVLAVTDACIIAQHSNINLLTIGLGKNQLNEINATLKRLNQNNIKPSGLICNYYSKNAMHYSYQSYNYYYYNYK